jgi:glycosyltransferase involved in cell wall biosynthesis
MDREEPHVRCIQGNDRERSTTTIAYVLKGYPRLSETFILQEILALERRGFQLQLYPIINPGEKLAHQAVQQVRAPVYYLHDGEKGVVRNQLWLLRTRPLRYLRVWIDVLYKRRRIIAAQRLLEAGRLVKFIERQNVCWLHAHFAHGPTSVAHFAHLLTGIPFSFSAHAKDVYQSSPDLLITKVRSARFVTTCTDASRRYLMMLLERLPDASQLQSKIHLVYHGVDIRCFSPTPAGALSDRANWPPLILSVGRLVEKKGFRYLIAACKILAERGLHFQCAIYGDGPLMADLQHQVMRAGLEAYVRLYGPCAQEDLPDIYRSATIFALAPCVASNGDRDGIPNVLLEAMATGLPVVTTDVGGIPELIEHGYSGLLVPEKDPLALADALEQLLRDETQRHLLGSKARHHVVTHFDAERTLNQLTACFYDREEVTSPNRVGTNRQIQRERPY